MFGGEPVNEDGSPIEESAEKAFARGHYEQHKAGRGHIRIGEDIEEASVCAIILGPALLAEHPLVSVAAPELRP